MSEILEPTSALDCVQAGWVHLHQQRPLAAWACWQRALRIEPGFPSAKAALDRLLLSPELPLVARTEYRFLSPQTEVRRERWSRAMSVGDLSQIAQAERVFRGLADADPDDVDARMNQALCLAWLGQNVDSIQAFLEATRATDRNQELKDLGIQACTLVELLRQGGGAEQLSDELTNSLIIEWTQPEPELIAMLARLGPVRAVAATPTALPGLQAVTEWFTGEWLDRPMPTASPTLDLNALPRIRASLLVGQGQARFSIPSSDPREMLRLERILECILGSAFVVLDRQARPRPIALMDADLWRIRVPADLDQETRPRLFREWAERYYENIWISTPKRALNSQDLAALTPGQAAAIPHDSDSSLRTRLEGLIAFREQLSLRPSMSHLYQGYPFDRLRRRLGLPLVDPSLIDEGDLSCMSPSEADELDLLELDPAELALVLSGPLTSSTQARIVGQLIAEDPRLLLSLDFPNLAAAALTLANQPVELLTALQSTATDSDETSKLELLEALLSVLQVDPELRPGTNFPLPGQADFTDPGVLPRTCHLLERAGAFLAAQQLEEHGIQLALAASRPWPMIDPQPPVIADE